MSRRDSQANAERIVGALCDLWTAQATPSMEQVAAAAGVGVATVYRHFPNRSALESAAFRRIFADEITPVVEGIEGEGVALLDVAERFVEVVGRYASVLGAVGVTEATDEALTDVADLFVDLLRNGQIAGVLRADLEPVDIFWLLRMMVLGLNSPLASASVRRRYVALVLVAVAPDETPLPALTEDDYECLGVPADQRRPPG